MKNLLIFLFLAGFTLLFYNHGAVDFYQNDNFIQDKFRSEKIAGHPERSRPERNSPDDAHSNRYLSR